MPDWSVSQWVALVLALLLVAVAALILYLTFIRKPGGVFIVDEGEEVMDFWRGVMDKRAAVRGRFTRRMALYSGFSTAIVGIAGVVLWLAF